MDMGRLVVGLGLGVSLILNAATTATAFIVRPGPAPPRIRRLATAAAAFIHARGAPRPQRIRPALATAASAGAPEDGRFDVAAAAVAARGSDADPVRAVLRAAGVSAEGVEQAYAAFPGLARCHPAEEVLRRLDHLNFLVELGVYDFPTAARLVAEQPRFLTMRFGVVHEDVDMFVLEKPHDTRMDVPLREGGCRKWPSEFTCSDWLDSGVVELEGDKKRFVHNLDSATSGILCVAKNKETAARCVDLFARRLVEKQCARRRGCTSGPGR